MKNFIECPLCLFCLKNKSVFSTTDIFNIRCARRRGRAMSIVETKNLKKYYGMGSNITKALDGVDFRVEKGEFVAVIGASGSGKSTLLHMIGGLDIPTSGTVNICGQNIEQMSDDQLAVFRRQRIGFVFQNYNLLPMLNVYENIVLSINLDGKDADKKFLNDIIQNLKIKDKLFHMPNQLSGGQQQRVAIARALISKPAMILADEPTGNLDSKTGLDVLELFQKTIKEYEQTLVMITHNEKIAALADRKVQIADGKIRS